jgi:hypothetical protein
MTAMTATDGRMAPTARSERLLTALPRPTMISTLLSEPSITRLGAPLRRKPNFLGKVSAF